MKKIKLSPWHDGSVKPVHIGVYERDYKFDERVYSFWNGKKWCGSGYSINGENTHRKNYTSPWQNEPWRGVLK